MSKITAEFIREGSDDTVAIEDNGKVAYAYFGKVGGHYTGFVWLYNRKEAPEDFEAVGRPSPVLNPKDYVRGALTDLPTSPEDFRVLWRQREGVWEAGIYIHSHIHAVVGDGDMPGWCVLAAKDGPVARWLELPEQH